MEKTDKGRIERVKTLPIKPQSRSKVVGLTAESFQVRIMMLLCYTVFFSVLNTTMFNVAIPDISRQFHLSPPEVSWVLTPYILIFGLGSVIYGKLADIYPVKYLITFGLVLFNAGAVVGFYSNGFAMLIAGRLMQACGGAAIPALSMLVATRYISVSRRGGVLGAVASSIASAGAFGPIVGGFIAGNFHWQYLFLVSVMTLFTIPFYHRLLPVEKPRAVSFDFLGATLLCAGVLSVLFFVAQSLWWGIPAGLVFLGGFVLRIHRTDAPFILPSMLKDRYYRNGLFTLSLALGTVFGMMFTLPLMLRNLNHLSTQAIGVTIFPGAMTAAVLGFAGGKLADRKGSVTVVYIGLGFLLTGYTALFLCAGMGPYLITLGLIISYSGFSIVQSSLAKTVSMTLPHNQTGVGMGMYNLTFFVSGAFGIAVASRIIEFFSAHPAFNPFISAPAGPYSNVFLYSLTMVIAAAVIFRHTFRRGETLAAAVSADPIEGGITIRQDS